MSKKKKEKIYQEGYQQGVLDATVKLQENLVQIFENVMKNCISLYQMYNDPVDKIS